MWKGPDSEIHRHGFSDVRVKMESIEIKLRDAKDFREVYDAFIEWAVERYWTERERDSCGRSVKGRVVKYMEKKFGVGKEFRIEKICMLATCKKAGEVHGK